MYYFCGKYINFITVFQILNIFNVALSRKNKIYQNNYAGGQLSIYVRDHQLLKTPYCFAISVLNNVGFIQTIYYSILGVIGLTAINDSIYQNEQKKTVWDMDLKLNHFRKKKNLQIFNFMCKKTV